MASSRCSGLSPSITTPLSVSSFHAPWFTSRTMTFIPRFIAAFWVLSLVRRLELKNSISRVLFLPSDWSSNGCAFTYIAFRTASLMSPSWSIEVKCLIKFISGNFKAVSQIFFTFAPAKKYGICQRIFVKGIFRCLLRAPCGERWPRSPNM